MARTTSSLVREIIEVDETVSLTPFIKAANTLVTKFCAPFTEYTEDHLQQIETWLAAHFYTVFDPRTVSEQAGAVQETFQSRVDLFLKTSHYGQHALILDFLGGLSALDQAVDAPTKPVSTGITWLGTPKE